MPRCIVLIVIDCLRADHVSSYGYERATTPTLDALAEKGVLWEQAHSLSSWTKPSVASILTGLYPSQHGAFEGIKRSKGRTTTTDVVRCAGPTLAEAFSEAGWRCGAFVNNAQLGEFTKLNRGFETYLPTAGKADRLIDAFVNWLASDQEKPAFAYLHFLEAHWPYKPRRRHMTMFGGDRDTNYFRDYSARDYGKLRRAVSRKELALSPEHLEQMVQMYDAAVRRLDGKIKIVLAKLKELGLGEETAIVVTADHGEEFLDHGQLGHGQSLYSELTHVPLVASVPGGPQGRRYKQPVSQVDLARTLLSIANIAGPLPGTDLLAPDAQPRPVCSELRIRRRYMQTLITGRWKLHRNYRFQSEDGEREARRTMQQCVAELPHEVQYELYDLLADAREQHNLADDSNHAHLRHSLEAELDRFWQDSSLPTDTAGGSETAIDETVVQRLRDLGYLD